MKPDEFEQKLSRQPLRQVPSEWRGEILAVCRGSKAEGRAREPFQPSTLVARLSTIFWPHPKAWAGLAGIWICIGVLNFSTGEVSPRVAAKSSSPSPEVVVELKKQQRMFAELVGSYEPADADRPRIFSPRPRSERVEILTT
ncbi:MAG: hypothetical protein RL616_1826 [Verrucomicrobiota bacterium]|jgi:hypothetical protein